MAGNKQGPVQVMSAGGPWARAGRGLPEKYAPRPRVTAGPGETKPAQPSPVTNTIHSYLWYSVTPVIPALVSPFCPEFYMQEQVSKSVFELFIGISACLSFSLSI